MGDLALVRALENAAPELREAALTLWKSATSKDQIEAATLLLCAARRREQRRSSDRATDHARRLLVGPRLPKATAERYKAAAAARHISMYEWASQALAAQYRREKRQKPPRRQPEAAPRRRAKPPEIPPW